MVRHFTKIIFVTYLLISTNALCNSFELRFSVVIENDANDVFPDSFSVFGNPETISNSLESSFLYHPPGPPVGNYVTIAKLAVPNEYTRVSLAYDPNEPDLLYSMTLSAVAKEAAGLLGNCIIQLENPEALQNLPEDCLVYIRRFDDIGAFIASYDLSDPDTHSFQWPVSEVSGEFGQLSFLVVDKCAAANLIISDTINLNDYAALAAYWNKTGSGISGDIYLDETVNLKDLSILAEKWLCSCKE